MNIRANGDGEYELLFNDSELLATALLALVPPLGRVKLTLVRDDDVLAYAIHDAQSADAFVQAFRSEQQREVATVNVLSEESAPLGVAGRGEPRRRRSARADGRAEIEQRNRHARSRRAFARDRLGLRRERRTVADTMKTAPIPFFVTDWSSVPEVEHPGETGVAYWRTVQAGDVRVRQVRYSAGYRADHWCARGHVVFVLSGELVTELKDGTTHTLSAGQSYQVSDDLSEHRSASPGGALLFIVD